MEIGAWRFTLREFFVIIHILFIVVSDARAERPYIVYVLFVFISVVGTHGSCVRPNDVCYSRLLLLLFL